MQKQVEADLMGDTPLIFHQEVRVLPKSLTHPLLQREDDQAAGSLWAGAGCGGRLWTWEIRGGGPSAHLVAQVWVLVQNVVALLLHARVLGTHRQDAVAHHCQLVLTCLHLLRQLCSAGAARSALGCNRLPSDPLHNYTVGLPETIDVWIPRHTLSCLSWSTIRHSAACISFHTAYVMTVPARLNLGKPFLARGKTFWLFPEAKVACDECSHCLPHVLLGGQLQFLHLP